MWQGSTWVFDGAVIDMAVDEVAVDDVGGRRGGGDDDVAWLAAAAMTWRGWRQQR